MSRSSILWFSRSTATRTARVPCSSIRLRANSSTLAGIQAALCGCRPSIPEINAGASFKHQFYGKSYLSMKRSTLVTHAAAFAAAPMPKKTPRCSAIHRILRQRRCLVVEDNELNLKLLNDLLEYQGYRVIATRLGEPALGLARQYKPDLILMDIQLPDISGMEATQRLKSDEQTRDIPVIAVTAFAMSGDEARILASGCNAYVSKPFNVAEFLQLVEHWTGETRS